MKPKSLYVHVPFCAHRCGYCDFVTTSRSPEIHERYVAALARELELRHPEVGPFDTIFIGGGTPTLLEPPAMEALLAWTSSLAAPGCETTIECNPETVTAELATQLVQGGIDRVSVGAQSFDPAVLAVLERRADPDTVKRAVRLLRDAGAKRISLDLIWGVPGQTADGARRDVDAALALEPDHVSAYELEFKPGTRLTHSHGLDAAEVAVGDAGEECYDAVIDRFDEAGWWWYETANFAREASERCRHNLAYWHADQWVGVGVGAVETTSPDTNEESLVRHANLPNVPRYLEHIERGENPPARIEIVDPLTARAERVMLGLRLDETLRIEARDFADEVIDASALERLVDLDLADVRAVVDPDGVMRGSVTIRLNRRGRMLQASVAGMLVNLPE